MFQFFNAPRVNYNYYKPTIYGRRYVPIESYLLNSFRQAQEIEIIKSVLYNSLMHQQHKDIPSKTEVSETENHIPDQIKETTENKEKQSLPSPIYYYESHSRFDGDKIIEERKERKIDSEGKVHHSLKRRLGDQWYETEQIEDKDGQIHNKETWHNVSEVNVENFKNEWISKSGQKIQFSGNYDGQNKDEIKDEKDKNETNDDQNKIEIEFNKKIEDNE